MGYKDKVKYFSGSEVQEHYGKLYSGGGEQRDSARIGSRYVPYFESAKLNPEKYKQGRFPVRILPSIDGTFPIFAVAMYELKYAHGDKYPTVHSPRTLDPSLDDPISELRKQLYKDGSERAKKFAKTLFPKVRHYMNVICRRVELLDEDGAKRWYKNAGPKVLILPDKPVKDIISPAWVDEEIGNPCHLESARDLLLHMAKTNSEEGNFPRWDSTRWSMELTPAGTDEQIESWLGSLHDLTCEYKPAEDGQLEEIAERLEAKYMGREGSVSKAVDGNRALDEDDDDEVAPPPKKRAAASSDDDEETHPPAKKKPVPSIDDDEENEAPPRRRAAAPVDDDDDEPAAQPPPKKRASSSDDPPPAKKRAAKKDDEDEEEDPPPPKKHAAKDEEEDPPPPKKRAEAAPADDDDDEDGWLKDKLEGMNKRKK